MLDGGDLLPPIVASAAKFFPAFDQGLVQGILQDAWERGCRMLEHDTIGEVTTDEFTITGQADVGLADA